MKEKKGTSGHADALIILFLKLLFVSIGKLFNDHT